MQTLSGRELLFIWETGQGQHPLDRALTILQMAFPEVRRETLARLSIGQRDSCLLAVREHLLGTRLASLAVCPACNERVEFALDTTQMQLKVALEPAQVVHQVTIDQYELSFRLPNSFDLATIVGYRKVTLARHQLLQRCVLQAKRDGEAVPRAELPEHIVQALAAQMNQRDPQAEILLTVTCGACEHSWQVLFDIVSFLWTEINSCAKRLLGDVHALASAYGWREEDILAMSPVRRQFYLEMVS